MRNKFPGICYRCKKSVKPYDGHFEIASSKIKTDKKWLLQHANCAIKFRGSQVGKEHLFKEVE